jgi:hypothetical protein
MIYEDNWETQEVINWLVNDEDAWRNAPDRSASQLKQWVLSGNAPAGLYESFLSPPVSSFENVNWKSVIEALDGQDEDDYG